MASSPKSMIYHPENLGISHIFKFLAFGKNPGSELAEVNNSSATSSETTQETVNVDLPTILIWIVQRILLWLKRPLALLTNTVEFLLNFSSMNGGISGVIKHTITGSLVIPNRESEDFRSIVGHIGGVTDLKRSASFASSSVVPKIDGVNDIDPLEISVMASKLAYENAAYVQKLVTQSQMNFVGYYNFWNEFLKDSATKAIIFCDRSKDARVIVVAFRGTSSTEDFVTDIDLSWTSMGEMGRVHVGFMKALGLQDETDGDDGWPKDYTGSKELAYYSIRAELKTLLQENKDAKILVTGHSLGGALALLFTSILVLHQEDALLSSLGGVYTFGQPRVGDKKFGSVMKAKLNGTSTRYHRVVFRYDIVPRIPFGGSVVGFSHFGDCLYFLSWYKAKVLKVQPNKNYFNPLYIPSMYFNAWSDLIGAIFLRKKGTYFEEDWYSFLFRIIGLIIPGFASHSIINYDYSSILGAAITREDDEIF